VVDAIGSVVAETLMGRLGRIIQGRAQRRQNGTTIHYGPGYAGWRLADQGVLFSYFSHEDVPVRLNEQLMMKPVKSLIGIVGLTPGGKHAPEIIPCQLCDLESCSMRRIKYRGKRAG
jgi:hypothetical protein